MQQASGHYDVRTKGERPSNLLRLKVGADGRFIATTLGNSIFGRTAAYRAAAPRADAAIAQALRATSQSGTTRALRRALRKAAGELETAAATYRPAPDAEVRTRHRMFVQGGAPGLGKRA